MNLIVNEFQVITTSRDDVSAGFYRPHKTALRSAFICGGFELATGSHPQTKHHRKLAALFHTHWVVFISERMWHLPSRDLFSLLVGRGGSDEKREREREK